MRTMHAVSRQVLRDPLNDTLTHGLIGSAMGAMPLPRCRPAAMPRRLAGTAEAGVCGHGIEIADLRYHLHGEPTLAFVMTLAGNGTWLMRSSSATAARMGLFVAGAGKRP